MAKKSTSNKSNNAQQRPQQAPRKRAVSPSEKNVRRKLTPEDLEPYEEDYGLLDTDTKRTIVAILCLVAALALLLVVLIPSDAVVASFLSITLQRFLGLGCYILPILLAMVGITFIIRFQSERVPARIIIGVVIIFLGALMLIALFTPNAVTVDGVSTDMFSDKNVISRGGYIGAGPAFVCLMLLGLPVSVLIAIGIIAIGFAVIGFSIRTLLDIIQDKRMAALELEEEEYGVAPDSPYIPLEAGRNSRNSLPRVNTSSQTRVIGADPAEYEGYDVDPYEPPFDEDDVQTGATSKLSDMISGERMAPAAATKGETQALTRRLGHSKDLQETKPAKKKSKKKAAAVAPEPEPTPADGSFILPDMSLLKVGKGKVKTKAFENELRQTAQHLQQTMEDFGIMATVVDWVAGPTVTLYEVDLPPGVRVSRLTALKDDIALALAAPGVRIFAPIPKTHYVGIEVPNMTRENVLLGDILREVKGGPLEVAIGKDVEGNPIIEDLARMPHLLIGGTTGSGKSVGINAMIMSILMRATPSQVRFIMIDPKRVEFAPYDGIPHLYVPVVTEPKEAASALSWGVAEMELRLKTYQKAGVRNIASYNSLVTSGNLRKMIEEGTLKESDFPQSQYIDEPMPYIVIVIDELADLMMNVGKEVEFSISRIAQLARAAGIHLIVATQRPSANVVTGLIKANITTRIAYNVASGLDSRVILDTSGAESLIGLGDLLISKPELGKPLRVQGCFTSDDEIASVVAFIKAQGEPEYHQEILKTNLVTLGDSMPDGSGGSAGGDDPLIWEAADIVVASGLGSTSNIQRKLKVGYSRAGRIMDMLEEKGIVGPPNGSKPRDVLVDAMELETLKAFEAADGQ